MGLAFCRAVSDPATSLEHLQFMVTPESRPLWCFPAAREALQAIGNLATGDAGVVLAVDRDPSSTVAYLHVLPEGSDPKDFSRALATLTLVWCAELVGWRVHAMAGFGLPGGRDPAARGQPELGPGLLQPPTSGRLVGMAPLGAIRALEQEIKGVRQA